MSNQWVVDLVYLCLAEYGAEKILKTLLGRTDPEDTFLQLDKLTKEELSKVTAMNMRGMHRFLPVFYTYRRLSYCVPNRNNHYQTLVAS